jgi:hypothetical protein
LNQNPGCAPIVLSVIFAPAEHPATATREIFRMNPKRLRAGKAVEQTGQSPPLHGSSNDTIPPTQALKTESSPTQPNQSPSKIPQILFEDDQPSKPAGKGLAPKFELGAAARTEYLEQQEPRLPEAYGTGKLLLTARDPHTLFAHWDLTHQQQHQYNSLSTDGRLALRAYAHAFSNQPAVEVLVEPDSRHLFLQVQSAGTSYVGELGYYQPDRQWKTVATSAPTTTPPDAPSQDTGVVFSTSQVRKETKAATAPADASIIPVSAPAWPFESEVPTESEQVSAMGARLQHLPENAPPFVKPGSRKAWTPVRERLLAEMIRISSERREWISSAEIAELVRHEIEMPPEIAWPVLPGALVNISSPAGEQWVRKGFWFNVNAELIIYGVTEPNAQVAIAGRPIKLRPDGTFSCHFALPDGEYALTATAVSPKNQLRQATLNFSRHTHYSGEVGAHPHNPFLEQIPQPE